MCVTEIFIDRYPDGQDVEFRHLRLCQDHRHERPCSMHTTMENPIRRLEYGDPSSEFLVTQLNTPPRSSGSSQRTQQIIEVIDERPPSRHRHHRKKDLTSLFMGAFFGDPPRRRRRSSVERVIRLERASSPLPTPRPRLPRTPPPPPLPPLRPRRYSGPLPPWERESRSPFPRSPVSPVPPPAPAPVIFEASPRTRGRPRTPIIHHEDVPRRHVRIVSDDEEIPQTSAFENRRNVRVSSVEATMGSRGPSRIRRRSPSPPPYEERLRQRQRDERIRRLAEQEAQLEAEIEEARERQRQRQLRDLQNIEIDSRRSRPSRPVVEQRSNRYSGIIAEGGFSARGERVIAEALAERMREDEEREIERAILAVEEAEDPLARRERLRRRFTTGGGGGRPSGSRRHRIVYDDGTSRYE